MTTECLSLYYIPFPLHLAHTFVYLCDIASRQCF
jgi:hypothetical protein